MSKLNRKAQAYIITTILAGLALVISSLAHHQYPGTWMMIVLSGLASLALIFKVEGSTNHSHYNISFLVYAFSLLLLGAEKTILVIVISNMAEWAWYKYAWYIPLFNASSLSLVIILSTWVSSAAGTVFPPTGLSSVAIVLLSLMAFTILNHLMVGLVIWFARQGNLIESGVFEFFPLMFDFTLMCMGAGTAILWSLNPFAVILTLLPLYLVYSTSKVPALERKTELDPKTNVYNVTFFNQALENELKRANRFNRPLTVVMADMDLLRNINNTYGHLAGDEVLIGIASILKESVREYDVVARFGGEEFVIMMPETSAEDVFDHVEKIRRKIEQAEFPVQTSVTPIKATMSFGIAGRQDSQQTSRQIIHNADAALYHSKLKGRNRVYIYTESGYLELFKPGERRGPGLPAAEPPQPSVKIDLGGLEVPPDGPTSQDAHASNGKSSMAPIKKENRKAAQKPAEANPAELASANRGAGRRFTAEQFVGLMLLATMGLLAVTLPFSITPNWLGLALFAVLVLGTEWLSIDIYVRDTSVSTSAAPMLAGFLLFGPPGVILLSIVLAGVALIKHRSRLRSFLFNLSNQMIAGLLCSGFVILLGVPFIALASWQQLLVSIGGATVIFLSTTAFVAIAMNLDQGPSIREIWLEKFSWLIYYYLGMGVIAYLLLICFVSFGMAGILIILGPLLTLRFGQLQYIDRTRTMVKELNKKNLALERSTEEISKLNDGLLNALAEVVDLRNPYLAGHSKQVARIAEKLARKMGLSQEQARLIHKAGLLHDVGKLGIAEEILSKPGKLTADEFILIQRHTTIGAEILHSSYSLHDLIPVVYHHHEHFDGSGYPGGLVGSETSIEARIIALADAVDAMASDRPYRQRRSLDEILVEVVRCSGTQFDPQVVAEFVKLAQEVGPALIDPQMNKAHVRGDRKERILCENSVHQNSQN